MGRRRRGHACGRRRGRRHRPAARRAGSRWARHVGGGCLTVRLRGRRSGRVGCAAEGSGRSRRHVLRRDGRRRGGVRARVRGRGCRRRAVVRRTRLCGSLGCRRVVGTVLGQRLHTGAPRVRAWRRGVGRPPPRQRTPAGRGSLRLPGRPWGRSRVARTLVGPSRRPGRGGLGAAPVGRGSAAGHTRGPRRDRTFVVARPRSDDRDRVQVRPRLRQQALHVARRQRLDRFIGDCVSDH